MNFIRICLFIFALASLPANSSVVNNQPQTVGNAMGLNLTAQEQAWLSAHPVIHVGMDPDYAPYEWINKNGQYVGMAVDYMRLLEQKLGVRFEIARDKSWAEAVEMAKRGELDILTSIVKTPERSNYFTFTEPYRDTQTVIIDNGQGDFIGDLAHLEGKRVALEKGYFTQELLEKDHPKIQLLLASNTLAALRLVMDGKADAHVGDVGSTNYAIKKNGLHGLRISGQTEYQSQHRFAVSKKNANLALIVSKAMAAIPKEESDAIFSRWMGLRIESGVEIKTVGKYGAGLSLVFLLVGYWVYRLRREIGYRKAAEMREHARSNILELLANGAPLPKVLEAIVRSAEQENAATRCSILLLDGEGKHLGQAVAPSLPDFYNAAIEGVEIGQGIGSCGTAAFTGERVIAEDIATHPYWVNYKELAARAGLGACWSQPIRAASGQVLGTFAIYHPDAHRPADADLAMIEQSAHLASIAIERSMDAKKLRDSEAHFRLLTEDASDVVWKADADLRISYISPVDERLRGYRPDEVIGHHVFEMFTEEGIAAVKEIMRQRQEAEQGGALNGASTFEAQHRCKDGRLLWAEVLSKPERDAHGVITGYHGITREITERKQMQDQVRQLAFYDSLTKLPNRRLLNDRLNQALTASKRSDCYGAVMILDLDNFKLLNDTHGHLAGDLLLIEVASRLTHCVREMDTVARFGGDEFVVMLSDLEADKAGALLQAGIVAEKIRISLFAPYVLTLSQATKAEATVNHRCSASIGVAIFKGIETSQDDVLRQADTAMYQAKDAGRNLVRFYESGT